LTWDALDERKYAKKGWVDEGKVIRGILSGEMRENLGNYIVNISN